jgi:hypothetical protein
MIKLPHAIRENIYIANSKQSKFVQMLQTSAMDGNVPANLKTTTYIHAFLKYPDYWAVTTDLFQYILPEYLDALQSKKTFFVFDCSQEGYSPLIDVPFFEILYYNCKKYNVDPTRIIYVSSNLKDEDNIEQYCQVHNEKKLIVSSFLFFEYFKNILYNNDVGLLLAKEKELCNINFEYNYFSSLNRRKRKYRAISTFLLCQEDISNNALLSHDVITDLDVTEWLSEYDSKKVSTWQASLPLTIDRQDFNQGHKWVDTIPYSHIHHQTLFQLVNETEAEHKNNTAFFYTEKTFKPIENFQPFIIYGQPGANTYLNTVGYNTYDEWFDLAFDSEEDHVLRFKKIIDVLTDTCKMLDSLSRNNKIEWRFKNSQLLIDNFNIMKQGVYNQKKLSILFKNIID